LAGRDFPAEIGPLQIMTKLSRSRYGYPLFYR
jgi:hypothetical protein